MDSNRQLRRHPSSSNFLLLPWGHRVQVQAAAYHLAPCWETHGLPPHQMQAAVEWALQQKGKGRTVYIFCTHGHGRSAALAAAILLAAGEAGSPQAALALVKERRPGASPNRRQVEGLLCWAAQRRRQE